MSVAHAWRSASILFALPLAAWAGGSGYCVAPGALSGMLYSTRCT